MLPMFENMPASKEEFLDTWADGYVKSKGVLSSMYTARQFERCTISRVGAEADRILCGDHGVTIVRVRRGLQVRGTDVRRAYR